MTRRYYTAMIIGYDPGGKGAHGLAVLHVEHDGGAWRALRLEAKSLDTLDAVMGCLTRDYGYPDRALAVGIDTLTVWNTGPAQWRPADLWLRQQYKTVRNSIQTPAGLFGSMAINGAAFLEWTHRLDPAGRLQVTEAHPKVCYHAATGRKHHWADADARAQMLDWLGKELGVDVLMLGQGTAADHALDAAIGALAALRGLNGEWTHDLHAEPPTDGRPENVHPFGRTHFWWPE